MYKGCFCSPHRCLDAARFFDIDLMKEEHMMEAYWITLYELVSNIFTHLVQTGK